MLRYFYLLSLLICFNFSFCYEYSSDKDSSRSSVVRRLKINNGHRRANFEQRKHRKRRDYDVYDKDPVAEIDVASFINNAEDEPINDNDPNNLRYKKLRPQYNNYGSLSNEISNTNEDYSDMDDENIQGSPYYMNLNPSPEEKTSDEIGHSFNSVQHNSEDNLVNLDNGHHKEKKCILKSIKLPFFSHNKSATAKDKNDKKRKVYGLSNKRKGNIVSQVRKPNLGKEDNSLSNLNQYKHEKKEKRSYIERLCPACRRKYIVNKYISSHRKRSDISKNTNDIRRNTDENNLGNNKRRIKNHVDDESIPISKRVGTYENYWNDKRRKREDDDRNIERQKELEYLEKRVDSVTVNNPSYNKVKL